MGRGRDFREPRKRGFGDDFFDRGPSDERPSPVFPPRAPRAASGPEIEATVKWFNGEKGFGFVALEDGSGEAFIHIRAVEATGHTTLEPGTRLTVRVGQGQKGPQVTEVTSVDTSTATAVPKARPPAPRGSFERSNEPGEEREGQVKWYNAEKGFGFIAVGDGSKDVFVHRSALTRAGLVDLQEGQRVVIEVVQGRKGPEANTVRVVG
jgi:cold shock protein